jgi:hypothetical protein
MIPNVIIPNPKNNENPECNIPDFFGKARLKLGEGERLS